MLLMTFSSMDIIPFIGVCRLLHLEQDICYYHLEQDIF